MKKSDVGENVNPPTDRVSDERLAEILAWYVNWQPCAEDPGLSRMEADAISLFRELQRLRSPGGARVKQDAARYQFLRGLHDPGPNDPRVHTLDQQTDPVQVRLCFGDDLDAAVDAAMRQP